ncbi:hypothetical protein DFH05DRAFT_1226386 [Lentinula detonsa]|uniref:VPS9 domain-containing protein n=1 Tax=Lentinula detonsa TaxID=2804962 RepID=A0A9W8NZA0_9AGAR|nr:hypothetical protein DFH05DRAFT_1226386 [Lentinula detonsa]
MVDNSQSSHNNLFPATSIGRSAGSKLLNPGSEQPRSLSRQSSRESLNVIAHPLLSPSSTGSALSSPSGSGSTTTVSNSAATTWDNGYSSNNLGYVPYTRTPRHKPSPASPTHPTPHVSHSSSNPSPSVIVTPATSSSSSSSANHLDATTKLQLMNLKAAAQALGLDAGTVGWVILEALAGEHGTEWDAIWDTLSTGKATLLLPSEPLATLKGKLTNAPLISPGFVRNHILYTESDGTVSGRAVSLSGLRGILGEDKDQMFITFASTLHPHTQSFRDISSPGTRAKGFASLMPSTVQTMSLSHYPTYLLPTNTPALSLPPRGSLSLPPPLPPRRNLQSHQIVSGSSRPSTPTHDGGKGGSGNASSRFAGFASLFGRNSSNTPNAQPSGSRPPSIVLSDTASVNEDIPEVGVAKDHVNPSDASAMNSHTSISVPAFVVSTSIIEQEILRGIWKGIIGDVEKALRSTSFNTFPSILPSILISFLESANALSVLRTSAPHPQHSTNKSKTMTKRLISGSGALREGKEGKEVTEAELHPVLDPIPSSYSAHAHADLEHYVYEINPYGVKEGWGFSAGATTVSGTDGVGGVVDLEEAETGAMEAIEDLSARWQVFYREVEDAVVEWVDTEVQQVEDEKSETDQESDGEQGHKEKRTKEILDQAEKVLCCVGGVYERLLPAPSPCTTWTSTNITTPDIDDTCQSTTSEPTEIITDTAHDDALASRIAALVMIDFGLRDLDLDVGSAGETDDEVKSRREVQVMAVLRACGNELCVLEKMFTPREKADAMVRAHRVLVDGLTKLSFTISLKDTEAKPESHSRSESSSEEEQEPGEEELETAVPWKKDDTFPQPEDNDDIDMQVQEEAGETKVNVLDETEADKTEKSSVTKPTNEKPPSSQATSFSLDTLFPLLILSVVISNPPRLISHLLFTQRFLFTHTFQASLQNSSSAAGEQAYCLVNLMAVAEFIGNLDLEGVVSARDNAVLPEDGLMPIPVPMTLPINIGGRPSSRRASMSSHYSATSKDGSSPTTPVLSSSFTLRNRVEQQASALSSSANKVLTGMSGVMDSSIGGFGGLFKSMNVNLSLPGSLPSGFGFGGEESSGPVTPAPSSAQAAAPWNHPHLQSQTTTNSRETIDRKESGFSIKSLKLPSMPNMPAIPNIPTLTRSNTPGPGDSREKEMVSVSRPGSVRSMRSTRSRKSDVGSLFGEESTEEDDESEDMAEDEDENEDESGADEENDEEMDGDSLHPPFQDDDNDESDVSDSRPIDTRSIKSFESMMNDGKRRGKVKSANKGATVASKEKRKPNTLNTVAGAAGAARKSLSDRLAKVSSGIGARATKKPQTFSPPPPASRRSSLLFPDPTSSLPKPARLDIPQSPVGEPLPLAGPHRVASPPSFLHNLPPPNDRFMNLTSVEDLRLGEVTTLLQEYQSLVQAVIDAGGFSLSTTESVGENPLGKL